jgi:exopolysaccharide biosynthesis protein
MLAELRPTFCTWLKTASLQLVMVAGIWCVWPSLASAQDISERPARTSEAVNALKNSEWRELEEGLSLLQASTALGTRLTVLKIDSDHFRFSVEQQNLPEGERADDVIERSEALLVVNGGFFRIRKDNGLFPVGLLMDDGEAISSPWLSSGGFVSISADGNIAISESETGVPNNVREAIQSRPVLIAPGGKWAMRTNANLQERRTLLCLLGDGSIILMVVSGGGLSLYEAGWLLRGTARGGLMGCDAAIALDGGGSTQLSVRGHPGLDVTGFSPVQNFLAVSRR